jgi:hypothetical protein
MEASGGGMEMTITNRADADSGAAIVALGGVPRRAVCRAAASAGTPGPAALFPIDTEGLLIEQDTTSETLLLGGGGQADLLGTGWSDADFDGVAPLRWLAAAGARALFPLRTPRVERLLVSALREPPIDGGEWSIRLRVNGVDLPAQTLVAGWQTYEWRPPAGLMRHGTNDVMIAVLPPDADRSFDPRTVAIGSVRAVRSP